MAKYMLPEDVRDFDLGPLREVSQALQEQAKPRSLEQSTLELYQQTATQRNLEHAPSLLGTKNLSDYLHIKNNNYFANNTSSDKKTSTSQLTIPMYNTQPEPLNSTYQHISNDYNRAA